MFPIRFRPQCVYVSDGGNDVRERGAPQRNVLKTVRIVPGLRGIGFAYNDRSTIIRGSAHT